MQTGGNKSNGPYSWASQHLAGKTKIYIYIYININLHNFNIVVITICMYIYILLYSNYIYCAVHRCL